MDSAQLLWVFICLSVVAVTTSSDTNDVVETDEELLSQAIQKRAPPMWYINKGKKAPVFLGMRGKKSLDYNVDDETDKRAPSGFLGMRGKKEPSAGFFGMRGKKAPSHSAFLGMRGKKAPSGFMGMRGKKAPSGFLGMRGKKDEENSITDYILQLLEQNEEADKRAPSSGFMAYRGRR